MKDENNIDKFFKQKLGDAVDEIQYREDDWDTLEQLLDKGKKRRGMVYWIPVLSSVAAILLIAFGWWFLKPQTTDDNQPKKQLAKIEQQKNLQPQNTDQTPQANNTLLPKPAQQIQKDSPIYTSTKKPVVTNSNNPVNTYRPNTGLPVSKIPPIEIAPVELLAVNTGLQIDAAPGSTLKVAAKDITNNDYVKGLAIQRNNKATQPGFKHPQYALTIMGAPDINGVSSFQQAKTGTNVGLLFSIGFNKLTITTGAAYSAKPYNTPFAYYSRDNYTFKTTPISVLADCRMLDIPLNIDYQVFNKSQNKISLGTGLSSYIMLKESYTYQYADPTTRGPRSYSIASPGKYFLSVLNLQATYKRQVTDKVGISVQPYLKLPLGEVGASQVRLQSAGVAIGLSWNINSLTKP